LAKAVFNLVANVDAMAFTKQHRQFELSRGRAYGKVPPWRSPKAQVATVEGVMRTLKVPMGWPSLPDSLESITTLKLEQTLALAGHMGQYLLELLNVDTVYHTHMQAYLKALQDCQQKTPVKPVTEIMDRFREAAAALEALLPALWSSATKHYGQHLDLFQIDWGCFWSTNELYHERMNGKMKRLSQHGCRNRMVTLANNWDAFQAANNWLLDPEVTTTYEAQTTRSHDLLYFSTMVQRNYMIFLIACHNTSPHSLLHHRSPLLRVYSTGREKLPWGKARLIGS
jgi:hypothetical protein